jgi:translocation and assembly module TamA
MLRLRAVRGLIFVGAALVLSLTPQMVRAQQLPAAPLDPESPMDALPGLGLDWPDLSIDPEANDPATAATTDQSGDRRYAVVLQGLAEDQRADLTSRFDALSVLKAGEGKPANAAQIDRRAREDAQLLGSLLRSKGYFEAAVDPEVATSPDGRIVVTLVAEPGALFRFDDVQVTGLDPSLPAEKAMEQGFTVKESGPVDAEQVLTQRVELDRTLKASGYPFAKVGEPQVVIDHDTQSATLALAVEPGGKRNFGAIRVMGEKAPFGAAHVARIARFRAGEPYRQEDVDDLRRALIATGLVSSATVEPVPATNPAVADMVVSLEPAKFRTIAAEAGYGTGEGIRVEGSWTHRNFFRPEGAVTARGVIGTREQYLGGLLRQSNFRKRDQILNARITLANENRPAFRARRFEVGAGLERLSNIIWQKKWTYSGGVEFITSDERDIVGAGVSRRRTYFIGALPLTLNYDGSNDLLDPTRGFRLGLRVSPEVSLQSGTFGYVRTQFDASGYFPVNPKIVVAGRMRLGNITGASSSAIAPSRRFYAGGGGSVRGYGYQAIGPRDIANDPDGGRSLAELALEARIRFGVFGVVPFVDAGNIYDSALPRLKGFRYGAGLGLRYYSNFGPIRIDVGTPINPQRGDTRVTVFVSLGQAF